MTVPLLSASTPSSGPGAARSTTSWFNAECRLAISTVERGIFLVSQQTGVRVELTDRRKIDVPQQRQHEHEHDPAWARAELERRRPKEREEAAYAPVDKPDPRTIVQNGTAPKSRSIFDPQARNVHVDHICLGIK